MSTWLRTLLLRDSRCFSREREHRLPTRESKRAWGRGGLLATHPTHKAFITRENTNPTRGDASLTGSTWPRRARPHRSCGRRWLTFPARPVCWLCGGGRTNPALAVPLRPHWTPALLPPTPASSHRQSPGLGPSRPIETLWTPATHPQDCDVPGFRLALPGSPQRFHCPTMTLPQLSAPSAPHPDGAKHPIPQKHTETTDQRPNTLTWGGKWGVVETE